MTADEVITEIRSLASDMAIRGACPGEVSPSLQYRITDFLLRAGVPFDPWKEHRDYLTKGGTAIVDGKEVSCRVHKTVIDDTAGELCREIAQGLMLAKWESLPQCSGWTADRAEQALQESVARLPDLCDRLAALTGLNIPAKPARRGARTPDVRKRELIREAITSGKSSQKGIQAYVADKLGSADEKVSPKMISEVKRALQKVVD